MKEIPFYGDYSELIEYGLKLGTLRKYNPNYDFSRGEEISANCKSEDIKIPVTVLETIHRPLKDIPVPLLALDGFATHEAAVKRMGDFYEGFDLDTNSTYVAFLDSRLFKALEPATQTLLTTEPLEDVIKNKNLREVFFPILCQWLVWDDVNFSGWLSFLESNGLVTPDEAKAMPLSPASGKDLTGFLNTRGRMQSLLESSGATYDRLVLGKV